MHVLRHILDITELFYACKWDGITSTGSDGDTISNHRTLSKVGMLAVATGCSSESPHETSHVAFVLGTAMIDPANQVRQRWYLP